MTRLSLQSRIRYAGVLSKPFCGRISFDWFLSSCGKIWTSIIVITSEARHLGQLITSFRHLSYDERLQRLGVRFRYSSQHTSGRVCNKGKNRSIFPRLLLIWCDWISINKARNTTKALRSSATVSTWPDPCSNMPYRC